MKKLFIAAAAWVIAISAIAQNLWSPSSEVATGKNVFEKRVRPQTFKLFYLDENLLKQNLMNVPSEKRVKASASSIILEVPNADGVLERYKIVEAPVIDQQLANKYPGIKSYAGQEINGLGTIRFDFTPLGFHAVLMSPSRPTIYIDPVDKASSTYIVVSRSALPTPPPFECLTPEMKGKKQEGNNTGAKNADDAMLRQFRIAIAAAGQYSAVWLDGTEPNDAARRAKVIAALNTNLVRVNGITERDFNARFNLIANNDLIVYLDANTDPFTTSNMFNAQAQAAIDGAIGSANYDIGHMVTQVGDFGNAGGIGTICNNANKGSGYTSRGNWQSGIYFEEYILTHEIGHQCDANHTFSHAEEAGSIAQVEPGSGTTIMSYAGITGPNTDIIPLMDDYFHAISIKQATDYIKATACASVSASGNSVPTANAGPDYTIPKLTPFKLTGNGTDADGGNVLSYVWEQMDLAPVFPLIPNSTRTSGPQFRSRPPLPTKSRTFPQLANILDGTNNNKWEVLSNVGRTLNFRFTVRDNNPGSGANKSDDMVLTIDENSGPFAVTSPNTNVTWCPGTHTVTWSVNGSDALAANVKISLSTDGGMTFPTVLAANTPNDGSENVTIGCIYSTMARIKVEAIGNIFFDISDANFTIGDNTKPTFTVPANTTIYKDANCNYDASVAITGDVTDEADNCSSGLDATFVDNVAAGSCLGESIITRVWTLTDDCGNSTVKNQTITVKDNMKPTFSAPANTTIYKDANCNYNAAPAITGNPLNVADNCDPSPVVTFSDVVVPGSCIGEEIITRTWKVTDACGNFTEKDQVITAKDTTRPEISNAATNPGNLWPANHKMVLVNVSYTLTDNCSPASAITSSLSVSSNEPVNGQGDGNTSPDWQVVNKNQVWLRAERSGKNKDGRIYSITINATDDCGNKATPQVVQVKVAHDKGNSRFMAGEESNALTVKLAPNPSNTYFTVDIETFKTETITVYVIDALGRRINSTLLQSSGTLRIGSEFKPGIYYLHVIQGNTHKQMKLIKGK